MKHRILFKTNTAKRLLCMFLLLSYYNGFANYYATGITNISPTTVAQFSRFEVGISLNANFPNNYNPSSYAQFYVIFTDPNSNSYSVPAFYYQDFNRCLSCPDPSIAPEIIYPPACQTPPVCTTYHSICNPNSKVTEDPTYLTAIATPLPWRARFAPNVTGQWQYHVYINDGTNVWTSQNYTLNVTSSSDKGYISIASNKRYFRFSDGTSFIPIGYNAVVPRIHPYTYNRVPFRFAKDLIVNMAPWGGNTIRVMMNPENYAIEWVEDGLGIYNSRQNRAYDLDEILKTAEENNVYIQLCLGVTSEFSPYEWNQNPYSSLVSDPEDFFTDYSCKLNYYNKLAYIVSRWGYSPHIFAYEMFNELAGFNTIVAGLPVNFWSNYNWLKMTNWHHDAIAHLKTLDNNHLVTTSVCFDAGNYSYPPFQSLHYSGGLDFLQEHYYDAYYNTHFEKNYAVRKDLALNDRPVFFGEHDLSTSCAWDGDSWTLNDAHYSIEGHNCMWSEMFSGAAGSGFGYPVPVMAYSPSTNSGCWGGQYEYCKPLSDFMSNEDLVNTNFQPISNKCSNYELYDTYCQHFNSNTNIFCTTDLPTDPQFSTSYISKGISTSNSDNIEVFALKAEQRVIGWAHYKKNYWYELPHTISDPSLCVVSQPCAPSCSWPGNITPLTGETVTIQGMCEGTYRIEFYSTYPEYDINQDGYPENGGIINSLTINQVSVDCDGKLTFTLPTLQPLKLQTLGSPENSPYEPDYGFKVIKTGDNWSHHILTWGEDQKINYNPFALAVDGNICAKANHIFYAGNDNRLHHLWPSAPGSWVHEWMDNSNNTSENVKLWSQIALNDGNATNVFYQGDDDRLQHYYWTGTQWGHEWLTDWNSNSQNVDGYIGVNGNGQEVFYRGADSRMHHYYWDNNASQWVHEWLTNANNTSEYVGLTVAVSASYTSVFYQGTDYRLHRYEKINNVWQHSIISSTTNSSENVEGSISVNDGADHVFYRGADGNLHHYYWMAGNWNHELFTWTNGTTIYPEPVGGDVSVSPDGSHVFFMGTDGWIHQRYDQGIPGPVYVRWGGDFLVCQASLNNSEQVSYHLSCMDNQSVFFRGTDDQVHAFLFNQGCDYSYFNSLDDSKGKHDNNMQKGDTSSQIRQYYNYQNQKNPAMSAISDLNTVSVLSTDDIVAYPNPFDNTLNIQFSNEDIYDIRITNILGTEVFRQKISGKSTFINTENFSNGIYIIIVRNKDGNLIKTIKLTRL